MDHGDARLLDDDPDLERHAATRRPDEHLHGWIVCFEHKPVIAQSMHHVLIADTVLAGARIDVHSEKLDPSDSLVNTC